MAMVTEFPDVSSWQAGLTIQPGTPALIAKASEGTIFKDPSYRDFETQSSRVGAIFSAYHFLHQGFGPTQADHAFSIVGPDVPLMLDVEPQPDAGSRPTVADALAFIGRYRARGGLLWATYFPRWYWNQVGGDLASLGTALIASGYPAAGYTDGDPNWQPYGGLTPAVWQYTDAQPYGGKKIDFNAFRGSAQELAALIRGGIPVSTFPQPDVSKMAPPGVSLAGKFTAGAPVDGDHCAFYADVRGEIAIQLLQQAIAAINALAAKYTAPPAVNVDALAAAIAPRLTAGATADELAHAVVIHLAAVLQAG